MKITFFDTNLKVCAALKKEFSNFDEITVCNKSLNELSEHDCLVTAGNSYGIMSGGIDYYVRELFGTEFQDILQWFIVEKYGGKMPVGCNALLRRSNGNFKSIIYAPTMEKPKIIVPNDISIVFYNILKTCNGFEINNLACCGLGTGTGGLPPEAHARVLKETYVLFNSFDAQGV